MGAKYERVTWAGLLVSESYGQPDEMGADRDGRNRMLAVLGAAVVLVEPAGAAASVARQAPTSRPAGSSLSRDRPPRTADQHAHTNSSETARSDSSAAHTTSSPTWETCADWH